MQTLLYVIFFFSGVCGLIYESIWSHYLKLFVGHAAYAQTVVLVVFIGGMAIGAWLAGRFSKKLVQPLWGYALAELLVGFYAIGFHKLYTFVTEFAYDSVLASVCTADEVCMTQWLIAGTLILIPSVLLGTTFPFMAAGVLRVFPTDSGKRLSLLYFLNSVGAALGVLASGFLLIPNFGLPGALAIAGVGNIVLALLVYYVGKQTLPADLKAVELSAPEPQDGNAVTPQSRLVALKWMLPVAALTGLASFVYEVVWIRSLSLVLGSSTHSFEIMLSAFILGLSLGSFWLKSRIDRIKNVLLFLAIVQVLMGTLALLTLPAYDATFSFMQTMLSALQRTEGGYNLYLLTSLVICILVMLPPAFCAGMTLPLITHFLLQTRQGEKSIGQVYAANSVGSILGVVITVHLTLPLLGMKNALVFGAAVDLLLGAYLIWLARSGAKAAPDAAHAPAPKAWVALGVACALACVWVVASYQHSVFKLAAGVFRTGSIGLYGKQDQVRQLDGKTSTIHVIQRSDEKGLRSASIMTNGKSDGSIVTRLDVPPALDESTMVIAAALPLAHHPKATSAAVIGFGTGLSTAALLGAPRLEKVVTIEIEPKMIEGARQAFGEVVKPAFEDPRSKIVIDDAKSFMSRSTEKYDIILSEPSNPWVSGVSSLFTEQFYRRTKTFLKPEGVFVQWIQAYEISPALISSIANALRIHFPHYRAYSINKGDLIFIASATKPLAEPSAEVFSMPGLKRYLDRINIRSLDQIEVRLLGTNRTMVPLFETYRMPFNSDFYPVVDEGAAKSRFMSQNALNLLGLRSSALPMVEVLEGRPQNKPTYSVAGEGYQAELDLASAYQLQRAILDASIVSSLPVAEQSALVGVWREAALFRQRFVDCSGLDWAFAEGSLDRVVASTLGILDADSSAKLWRAVTTSKCSSTMPAHMQAYVAVVQAVAERRWPGVPDLVKTALKDHHAALSQEAKNTLAGAWVLAVMRTGNLPEARDLMVNYLKSVPAGMEMPLVMRVVKGMVGL